MARRKVSLKLIADRAARRATFKKRRASVMKKAHELATLCGVDACVVVYGEGAPLPEVWPPSPTEAARVLRRFRDVPEMERSKKMMDMEGFLQQRNAKLEEQLERARRENGEREAALLLHDAISGRRPVAGLSGEELSALGSMVKARLRDVGDAVRRLHEQGHGDPLTALQLSLAPAAPYNAAGAGRTEVHGPGQQGWPAAGGFGGGRWSFGGGASTSEGMGDADMLPKEVQLGKAFAGLPWAGPGPSFPPPM